VSNDLTLGLAEAVLAYREEYLIEQSFARYKGKVLNITPLYLSREHRVKALVRLLSIGLRVLGLFEYSVRKRLYEIKEPLCGIYKGNPKRKTSRPTTEMMLKSFEGVTLTELSVGKQKHQVLSPLTEIQEKILSLAGLSFETYSILTGSFSELPPKMHER